MAYRSHYNNKIPAEHGDFWYNFRIILNLYLSLADGEGFEPPVELPPQRFSRPSQSTALPPILNFIIPPVFQTCGFVRWPHLAVLLTTRSHSTALTLVSLTRMQDRRNRPRLPPILNFIVPPVFQTCGVG